MCGASPPSDATCGLSTSNKNCPSLTAYTTANPCTNNNASTKGNTAVTLTPGVYFISGNLTMTGGSSITGTGVTLILLPGATITMKGGSTITITGPTSAPGASSLPPSLQADASLFEGMALYDASNAAVQFGGTSNINITGNIYAPTAAVTFQGNPTISLSNGTSCGELIAASIAFNGNATFDDSGCPGAGVPVPSRTICAVGAMMRKLDNRGAAAWEFILVAVPLFMLIFVIFDLGRFAITLQSLNALANWGARAVMINCYTPDVIQHQSPSGCTGDPPVHDADAVAGPFLYAGGLTPTLSVTAGAHSLTVTASESGFKMIMPIWGTALNAPSASASIPF